MEYLARLVDTLLEEMLAELPAIAIDGPKGVGKTATASRLADSVINLDREAEVQAAIDDPLLVTRFDYPLLVDEWQNYPPIWDQVRRAVDNTEGNGLFLLTGSATPSESPKHSGAGRIVHLRMRPFSWAERFPGTGSVSLEKLMHGEKTPFAGTTNVTIEEYAEEICAGGFPRLRGINPRFRRRAWDGYLTEVLDRDLPELGRAVRRRDTLRAWLTSYARATSSVASYTDILDNAMPSDSDKPAKATTIAWRETLSRMWLLDPIPPWQGRIKALGKVPKHHLADPALAAHLCGVTPNMLLTNLESASQRPGTLFGALFESLVALSVRVYAEMLDLEVSHLRTNDGAHEIDLILTTPEGKVLAIEVKSSPSIQPRDTKHLRWIAEQLGPDLIDTVIVNTGPAAYRRSEDGIAVIPLSLLCATEY